MEEGLPPGFRFHPTDEELVVYYLASRASDSGFSTEAIADVDLNKCEPWDLPGKAKMMARARGAREWYFFSLRDRKYPTGLRTNRATGSGYWKTTGKDREVRHSGSGVVVGMKKTLVFYKGRAPKGHKTNWVMHEYRHHPNPIYRTKEEEWAVCRVFRKTSSININTKKPQECSPPECSQSTGHDPLPDVTWQLQPTSTDSPEGLDMPWNNLGTSSTSHTCASVADTIGNLDMNWFLIESQMPPLVSVSSISAGSSSPAILSSLQLSHCQPIQTRNSIAPDLRFQGEGRPFLGGDSKPMTSRSFLLLAEDHVDYADGVRLFGEATEAVGVEKYLDLFASI